MRNIVIRTVLLVAALGGLSSIAGASSLTMPPPLACLDGVGENCPVIELAQSSCAAAAAAAARQRGGEVIGAPRTIQQGGREMCEFTILIPDPSGQKPPRRERMVIPLR